MTNLQKVKNILISKKPWDAIINERELFGETIDEMDGVQHVNYHFEGGVLEHVKLAFDSMMKIPGHDWFDLLIVLFHDVGKKKALAENNGKNMAKHELYSSDWFYEWHKKFDIFGGNPFPYLAQGRWVIEKHMAANQLYSAKNAYKIMNIVTDQYFPRLARLATADGLATLDESGKPMRLFSETLELPRVKRWIGQPRPCPIVLADDFIEHGVPAACTEELVEFGLKLQINFNNQISPERIIHDVLSCDKMKDIIDRAKAMLGQL